MFDINSIKEIKLLKQSERQKVLLTEGPDGKRYIKREINGDKREIYKALQKINQTNIPKIYYVGFNSDTVIFEEYIEGISLNDFILQGKKLSKKQICSVSKQVLSALDNLHQHNIIHRDIKPDNILIDEANHVWLTDYDIARIYRKEVRRDTETIGTFGYAPIEQYGMLPTDFKTDIYAFGVTLKSLLDYCGVNGTLYKIAEKCKRLDPQDRYKSVSSIKRALSVCEFAPLFVVLLLVLSFALGIVFTSSKHDTDATDRTKIVRDNDGNTLDKQTNKDDTPETGEVGVNEYNTDLIRFVDFNLSGKQLEYATLENYNTTPIFSGEGVWHYLPLMEDTQTSGTILLGKNHKTPVEADVSLKDGIFSVSLQDKLGHSFSKDFYLDDSYEFDVTYPNNRRINAEMVCRDMDGDAVEELLIGICDCSMTVTETSIYQYFNYSIGWALKYDEARGFILCEGDMFSENSKLVFIENDLRVHLPYTASNTDDKDGYELKGNKIIPFIM